jgi:hypothetical protein
MRGSAFGGSCRIVASGQAGRIREVASLPARSGFDKLKVPACQVRPLLGGRSTVGHRALDAVIGVRIPASQPTPSLRSVVGCSSGLQARLPSPAARGERARIPAPRCARSSAARQGFRHASPRLRLGESGHESLPPSQIDIGNAKFLHGNGLPVPFSSASFGPVNGVSRACQIYDVGPDYLFMRRCASCARIARVSAIRCTIPSRPRVSWSLTTVPGAASAVSISRR